MSGVYTTDAIVLRRGRFGEHGVLLTLFTPEFGKVDAIAKGVYRPGSKLAGHLEPLLHIRLQLARGRNLDVVTQASILHPFEQVRNDLYRTAAAWYAAELVERLTEDRQESHSLYELLLALLSRLDGGTAPDLLLRFFEMRLLSYLGYRPALWRCAHCGDAVSNSSAWFSPSRGGIHCTECATLATDGRRLSAAALQLLRFFQTNTLAGWETLKPDATGLNEASQVLRQSIRALDEQAPRGLVLLDRLRTGGAAPHDGMLNATTRVAG
jgi:DNA repair protein RecO (recombination protein O)